MKNFLSQSAAVQMRIDFGCGDTGVSEHLLHRAQISAILHEVGSEGMAKCMGTDGLADARFFYLTSDDIEYSHPAQFFASQIQKNIVFVSGGYDLVIADIS